MTVLEPAANSEQARINRLEKLRFWRRACADSSQTITPYNIEGSSARSPLFFFHGDYDSGGLYVRRLAALSKQPIIAVAPQGIHDDGIAGSIEEMAAARLDEILALRPHGPYRIGGYCNGALVAFEMARLLQARGETIEIALLLEPSSLNARAPYRLARRLLGAILDPGNTRSAAAHNRIGAAMWQVWSLGRILKMPPSQIIGLLHYLNERRATRKRRLIAEAGSSTAEREVQEKFRRLTNAHYRASAAHVPQMVDFPVVALSTGRDGGNRRSDLYDAVSWQAVCRNFQHFRLDGHHSTCLSEGIETLAALLGSLLADQAPVPAPDKGSRAVLQTLSHRFSGSIETQNFSC